MKGEKVNSVAESGDLEQSIVDHLTRLLNARQGALVHLPDYGLPDITAMYMGLPYSVKDITEMIRQAILKYEPRLNQVRVECKKIDTREFVLQMVITARLVTGKNIALDTFFMSSGNAEVKLSNRRNY